jgi:hypothetical protein
METTKTTEKPERFQITTQAEADLAVSLLADLEDREARITAQYQKMLAQFQTDNYTNRAGDGSEGGR